MYEYGQLERKLFTEANDLEVAIFLLLEHYVSITYFVFILYKSFSHSLFHLTSKITL